MSDPSSSGGGRLVTADSDFSWRGYSVWGVIRVVTLLAAYTGGWWLASNHSGQPFRDALTAALIPVGFLMVFGFGYAGDTFSKRIARYGPEREAPTTVLVLLFFGTALVTVALILVYLALGPSDRILAVARLPARDQKWWRHTYPMIVGAKGPTAVALKPALNALELWKTQDRIQALLGASQSTLRFRDIIDEGKILFLTLNDGSETDNLLARLIMGEMITAFKERSLTHQPGQPVRPFHLFLDEFQAYVSVLEAHAEVFVQELRKFGAKVHFINQSPSALSPKTKDMILANRTHLFAGKLGNLKDAENIAKAMGGQQRTRPSENQRGPAPIEGRDLLGMPSWHFTCQITHNGETSAPFQLKGINVEQAWKHLKTDRDITQQIAANTGLEPIHQRLAHYDTLPERIAHWLQTNQPPTTQPATQQQQHTTGPPATAGAVSGSYSNSPITDPQQVASIHQWAEDCIIEDPHAVTPTNQFTVSYTQWCQQKSVQPLPVRELQQHLTHQHGPSQTVRIDGKVTRIRKGIKPRTPADL